MDLFASLMSLMLIYLCLVAMLWSGFFKPITNHDDGKQDWPVQANVLFTVCLCFKY